MDGGGIDMKVVHIDDFRDEKHPEQIAISEVICLFCMKRWIAQRPRTVRLWMLECPACGRTTGAIETGEDLSNLFEEGEPDET